MTAGCVLAWMDVISTELDRSMAFYGQLFEWQTEHLRIDHGEAYHLVRSRGHIVSGAEAIDPARNLEPVWTVMVECDDARTFIDKAVAAGGKETFELSPMLDLGSIAMVRDPWGATVGIWEPKGYRPSEVPLVPGRLVGALLETPDAEASARYYSSIFGWSRTSEPTALGAGLELPVVVDERPGPSMWTPVLDGTGMDRQALPAGRVLESGRKKVPGCEFLRDPMGAAFLVRT